MDSITFTRQVGSWGDYIAVEVAKALNLRYVDREIISTASEKAGVPETTLEKFEDRKGLIERIRDALSKVPRVPLIPSQAIRLGQYYQHYDVGGKKEEFQSLIRDGLSDIEATRHVMSTRLPESDYLDLIRSVVIDFARTGNVVLAGSGSRAILKDWPQVMHVLITAPTENRISAIMEQEKVDGRVAERRVKESDEARLSYMQRHYQIDLFDASLYDLSINTGRFSQDLAVEVIVKSFESIP